MGGPAIVDCRKIKEFDNFYRCEFIKDGISYFSSEQYYQSKKNSSKEFLDKILKCKTSGDAWKLGNECKLREDWENVKVYIMTLANYLKFTQNNFLMEILINTFPSTITFSRSTPFWNEANACILTRLREAFIS